LFGTFPYGRPLYGTPESLKAIDAPEIIDAKIRFLTADNATVAITGNFEKNLAVKAVKRYFGGWLRSDKLVPSTFRQPDEPNAALMSLPSPHPGGLAARFAFRGVARSDKNLAASLVFSKILETRLKARTVPDQKVFVRDEYRTLPGLIIVGLAVSPPEARQLVLSSIADPATDAEVQAAKAATSAEWQRNDPAQMWLDADTYKIGNVDADVHAIDNVSLADVNAYIQKAKTQPVVSVVIGAQPAKN